MYHLYTMEMEVEGLPGTDFTSVDFVRANGPHVAGWRWTTLPDTLDVLHNQARVRPGGSQHALQRMSVIRSAAWFGSSMSAISLPGCPPGALFGRSPCVRARSFAGERARRQAIAAAAVVERRVPETHGRRRRVRPSGPPSAAVDEAETQEGKRERWRVPPATQYLSPAMQQTQEAMIDLVSQDTVEEIEVMSSGISAEGEGAVVDDERTRSPDAQLPSTLGADTLEMGAARIGTVPAGIEGAGETEYFDIMGNDFVGDNGGDHACEAQGEADVEMDAAQHTTDGNAHANGVDGQRQPEHLEAPPFVKAKSIPSDIWLGARDFEAETARLLQGKAMPQRGTPQPWPQPPTTPPSRGQSAAAATPTRPVRTGASATRRATEADAKLDKMMEMLMRNHESVKQRFDVLQVNLENQARDANKRFEEVDEHFHMVEEKIDYANEQARARFEGIEERLAKLERGGGDGYREGSIAEVVFGNFSGEEFADELVKKVRPVMQEAGMLEGVKELYARSRRPTVLFLKLADKSAGTRVATRIRQAKINFEGKIIWANRDRSKEERMRLRPVGKLIAELPQARDLVGGALREGKDAEGGWRHREEEVRVTTNRWRTSVVMGRMMEGKWQEATQEQLQSTLGCEWYAKLREVRSSEN